MSMRKPKTPRGTTPPQVLTNCLKFRGKRTNLSEVLLALIRDASRVSSRAGVYFVLKGGTVATQYSDDEINMNDIDIQVIPKKQFDGVANIDGDPDLTWALRYGSTAKVLMSFVVFVINNLKRLNIPGRFKLRAKMVSDKTVSVISIDHYTPNAKKGVPVLDVVLGKPETDYEFSPKDISMRKGLIMYSYQWIVRDLAKMLQSSVPIEPQKLKKRQYRLFQALRRSPKQIAKDSNKLGSIVAKIPQRRYAVRGWGDILKCIVSSSDTPKTKRMLLKIVNIFYYKRKL